MAPKSRRPKPSGTVSTLKELYRLDPATSGKKGGPRALQGIVEAAKRAAKQTDAVFTKSLGADPGAALRAADAATQRCGLRNLGATCYMNSLLQSLFMNLEFRQGIYGWTPPAKDDGAGEAQAVAEEVCRAIQELFAHLEVSKRQSYDPAALTSALSLDVAVQQDAQEFNKLLLSFLEDLDPKVRTLVERQFRGNFRYVTTCTACGKPSASSANHTPFYELELNVKCCASIEESLRQYTASEQLEGVECATCAAKHNADRAIQLVGGALPPVLCLQLLRFVYDVASNSKKKVSSSIEFPETLDLAPFLPNDTSSAAEPAADTTYRLTAVLMHTGTSANSGHYTAVSYTHLRAHETLMNL
eukprot:4726469-Prymnesium_polylepis.1